MATPALANNSIYLPPTPQGPGGEDSIETADGVRCRQSMNSNGSYFDAGAAGRAASAPTQQVQPGLILLPADRGNEALVYVRVTVPIGKRPGRIDCSRLYELEIARLKRENELLRMAAE